MKERSGCRASDAVSNIGKDEKEAAADYAHHQGKALHHFIHLLGVSGEQTVRHPIIRESNGGEHHHRHDGMNKIIETNSVTLVFGDFNGQAGLEHCQPLWSDKAVVDVAVRRPETVSEVEEEAGEGAEAKQDVDHECADRRALPPAVHGWEDHLKGEKCPGWEEVCEHGCPGQRFLNPICHRLPFPATAMGLSRGWLWGRWVDGWIDMWGCIVDFDSNSFGLIHYQRRRKYRFRCQSRQESFKVDSLGYI